MADLCGIVPIPGFSDYGVTRDGEVWRLTHTVRDVRWGPTPRKLTPLMMGCKNSRSPHVRMGGKVRSVRQILAATFPSKVTITWAPGVVADHADA